MATHIDDAVRTQLMTRRGKLESAIESFPGRSDLTLLLHEVDAALSRIDLGSFGICEVCHEAIEPDRLAEDPLLRFCLDHLTVPQQRALEQDLDLAAKIQSALLPKGGSARNGWRTAFHFQPAGPVSGDYCDLIPAEDGSLYFVLGDVSGKGVAASMLMSHLQAMFRALTGTGLPLVQVLERASRLFCESTLSNHYATLVCGRAEKDGSMEICNAGHLPPLVGQGGAVHSISAGSLPLGMFCIEQFPINRIRLNQGDCLLLYTDGLSEGQNREGMEFGADPLIEILRNRKSRTAEEIVNACLAEAADYRSGLPPKDDLTLMVIERIE
jgi:sigma-B regulation protein RsbU (phosphoserine phosphatase)